MHTTGLKYDPFKVSCNVLHPWTSSSSVMQVFACSLNRHCTERKLSYQLDRMYWCGSKWSYHVPKAHKVRSTMDASFGGESSEVFPRINIKDPYKRLGISREATEDEIQAARNFLISKYAGHQPSVDAIESAHDKIIMQSFHERKSPKLNIKKKMREVSQTRVAKAITSRFEVPSMNIVMKTAAAFAILGVLTVLYPTEEGPTLQVAISLVAAIYFIYQRLRSRVRAVLYGLGVFFGSWLLGTFLMVSVIPPVLKGPRSLEVTTSLITYVFLWVSSSYLK
ncbi:unnamed protein product [Victoria cruziana]